MNDVNELISGWCWSDEFCPHFDVRWRWLDIGGGGPVMPAEVGTSISAVERIEAPQDKQFRSKASKILSNAISAVEK